MKQTTAVGIAVAILSLITSALPAIFLSIPQPNVHDEFIYLLAGEC